MQKLKIATAVAALLGMGGAAIASDDAPGPPSAPQPAPAQPAQNWSGAYAGANAGVGSSAQDINTAGVGDPAYLGGGQLTSTGAFGGGQFGYNLQSADFLYGLPTMNLVYGVEVDAGGMSLGGTKLNGNRNSSGSSNCFVSNDNSFITRYYNCDYRFGAQNSGGFYGDATGRLGVAFGNALVYGKGGFAWLDAQFKRNVSVLSDYYPTGYASFNHTANSTLTGWTAGGGVEWKLTPNWSFKVEYLHFDLATNDNYNYCNPGFDCRGTWYNNRDVTIDTVKFGVNYFFNNVPSPLTRLNDGPYVAPPVWTGFYAGVIGGISFGASNNLAVTGTYDATQADIGQFYRDGGFGGGQIGYNWSGFGGGNQVVLGVEADIQGSGISSGFNRNDLNYHSVLTPFSANQSIDYFGTLRGRLGYAVGNALFYATGGLAYANINTSFNVKNGATT